MNHQDLRDWTDHPITKILFLALDEKRINNGKAASEGAILYSEEPIKEMAKIVGQAQLIDEIVTLTIFNDRELEDESIWNRRNK